MPTTFTNQATLAYNGARLTSNIAVGEIVQVLSVTKTPVSGTYAPGDDVTYIISIINSGTDDYDGLIITDNLGEYTVGETSVYPISYVEGSAKYYINGAFQSEPTVTPGPPMVISGINVPAGGNATIIYDGVINSFALLEAGSTITNTATVTGAGLSQPIVASATVTAANAPDLSISKSISPNPVTENSEVTFTFVIQNTGNAAADTGVVVSDVFNPALTDITVTFNDQPLTPTTQYTYDPSSGQFATVGNTITVPAATYEQDPTTGIITTTPGVATLTITGTI